MLKIMFSYGQINIFNMPFHSSKVMHEIMSAFDCTGPLYSLVIFLKKHVQILSTTNSIRQNQWYKYAKLQ